MKHIICAAAIAVAASSGAHAKTFTDTFTSFYSFGDSLSDDGKFSKLDPPSFGGRFSNGLVWAELIEDQFIAAGRDTGNLALGGSVAGDVNTNPAGPLSTFGGQVATFAGSLAAGVGLPTRVLPTPEFKSTGPEPGSNPLMSVWFGSNDIFQGFDPVEAANTVARNIRALHNINTSVFDDFLVVFLPDIGATPAFAGERSQAGTRATKLFNAQLFRQAALLESEGVNIIGFRANSVFNEIRESVERGTFEFGIFDVTTPCTLSMGAFLDPNTTNPGNCVEQGFDPNNFLFSDAVHPNAVAHQLFAEAVGQKISAVPVPAGLPLMLTVFAGIGLMARRRRV